MSDFTDEQLIRDDIDAYLARYESRELLRFVAVGSVDDGKSTLIGRLLYDSQGVYEDQLKAVQRASSMEGTEIDFSLFTDGLKAEREQGITIDVAYRYFSTPKRKFIIADTPGHVQYTRNMVTGASTADVAIILIDARLGVLEQSRRHGYIGSLLGIPHLLVAVNKMDLVEYSGDVYDRIRDEFSAFTRDLRFKDVTFVPVSALRGENVASRARSMPWYDGPTVLEFLESVPIASDRDLSHFRYPVQLVLRPNLDYRGFAGQVASGRVRRGDTVRVLPSRKTTRVRGIDTFEGEVSEATVPMSVTLRLEDEVDVSRGDMLVHVDDEPMTTRSFRAEVVWMHETPLDPHRSYFLKHTTQRVRAHVTRVASRLDLHTLRDVACDTLQLNDIGHVEITCHRSLYVDRYAEHRATGAFILIDALTNNTVGAGMIREALAGDAPRASQRPGSASDTDAGTRVGAEERARRFGQRGTHVVVAAATLEGARSLAAALEREMFDAGHFAVHVGDEPSAAHTLVRAGIVALECVTDVNASADTNANANVNVTRGDGVFVVVSGAGAGSERASVVVDPARGLGENTDRVMAALRAAKKLWAPDGG